MNSTLVVTAAAVTGIFIFAFMRKKQQSAANNRIYNKVNKHDKHTLTHAFAKAKKQSMADADLK